MIKRRFFPLAADAAVVIARVARAMSSAHTTSIKIHRHGACWEVTVERRK